MVESPYRILKVAAKGDLVELERLLKGDPERLGMTDKKGWTPMHHAAAHNQIHVITFLVNHGA
ncbi:2-5A-dependent ribonuclease-like, partial [Homarus americanus]